MKGQLTKVQRIRMTTDMVKQLEGLKAFGLKPSTFIREAINEKMKRDTPKLLVEQQRKSNLIKCPF